jgi:tripartite ATP-independent transporter DctM subunit
VKLNPFKLDELISSLALLLMAIIPVVEILARPIFGKGIENAPILVQHFGLVMSMFGAIAAYRFGHLSSIGVIFYALQLPARLLSSLICGLLCWACWHFVSTERSAHQMLAYSLPIWIFQLVMPVGFLLLSWQIITQGLQSNLAKVLSILSVTGISYLLFQYLESDVGAMGSVGFVLLVLVVMFLGGAPIFSIIAALALGLFWQEGLPLSSVALSHYQITVNASLPALPLFTLAGLVFASTGSAKRLGQVFMAVFGTGVRGTVFAATVLCSFFTAFTGGSGVTILALGGLLLQLLSDTGYSKKKGISLVTSASALGVLLAPSVPLIMYAIIARVPINAMFLAGIVPAVVMVLSLLVFGGYLKQDHQVTSHEHVHVFSWLKLRHALWDAKWEIFTPFVAIGSLVSGFATPTESAAITAVYALVTQMIFNQELSVDQFKQSLLKCTQIIGGVMLVLGMALGMTNYLIDAGIPDLAIQWVQSITSNKYVFLLALNLFLFFAGALMEIYAAIVVLVPLLLPLAMSYDIHPIHFGIIFLANMEMGFLCPPAGMNIYFASAVFNQPLKEVAISIWPALIAIFVGTVIISWLPILTIALPEFFNMV